MKIISLLVLCFIVHSYGQGFTTLGLLMGDDSPYLAETLAYQTRVEADGGTVINIDSVDYMMRLLADNSLTASCKSFVSPNYGVKKNANNKVTKLYSLIGTTDFVQTDTSKAFTWVATGGHNGGASMTCATNDYMDLQPSPISSGADFTANIRTKSTQGTAYRLITVNHSAANGSGMCLANQPTLKLLWEGVAWGSKGENDNSLNAWKFYTMTRDGNLGYAYVDGSATTFDEINAAPIEGTTGIRISAGGNSPTLYYTGTIEDVSIFSSILTNEQINLIK